ncbi:MAG: 6-phosphogluconolactonase [Marivirga sp.]|nr:6-phosphogluconolactonase [Marivirga sp.]
MKLHVFKSPEEVIISLADFIVSVARASIEQNGQFNFVLSGGSSPKKLFELLAHPGYRDQIEWQHVYFFFGDERYVPLNHKDSNFLMAQQTLFSPVGISEKQIFAVNTSLSPAAAALDYEKRLVDHFKPGRCEFDLILLGLGDNSHTASLFPHSSVLHEKKTGIKEIFVDEVNMYRITFTAALINSAHNIAFLVYGASKADAVKHILDGPSNIEEYPAQLIHPYHGVLHWFMDEAAAGDNLN